MSVFHKLNISDYPDLPEKCNNPFDVRHSDFTMKVAEIFMEKLKTMDLGHRFGLSGSEGLGKMFGILIGKNVDGEVGYLVAFSGKLESGTLIPGFVPPVFDTYEEGGIYKTREEEINQINAEIIRITSSSDYEDALKNLENCKMEAEKAILQTKEQHTKAKAERKIIRALQSENLSVQKEKILSDLNSESARHHFEYKDLVKKWKIQTDRAQETVSIFQKKIDLLKDLRKKKSASLQEILFSQYTFLNFEGITKNLAEIFSFSEHQSPPSGAGECAAPKLFQYAIKNDIFPLGIAEFWWGISPASEIRIHRHFYPACRSKCLPILQHMLLGLEMESLMMSVAENTSSELDILYEDEVMVIINKAAGFLSVPGKSIADSVLNRLKKKYPNATGPLLVHRLDMSTSGILLAAKTKEVHRCLQKQFQERKIKKRYVAVLNGIPDKEEGLIDLPIRVDLEDRPRQLVCFEHGKEALTLYKVVSKNKTESRVHFFPVSGRTHQLRVHAAHFKGLGIAIKGDDLYGKPDDRLYLHAEQIKFTHPITGKSKTIFCKAPF